MLMLSWLVLDIALIFNLIVNLGLKKGGAIRLFCIAAREVNGLMLYVYS